VVTYKYGANVFSTVKAAYLVRRNKTDATRAFHDAAIGYGSMPLATFEALFPELVADASAWE